MRSLSLLLPALVPSWRFFDTIGPSPRIEYALLSSPDDAPEGWQEFRPRPQRVSPLAMLTRLFWNPRWNETLFLVSCSERLMDHPTPHSEDEIYRRIATDLARGSDAAPPLPWLCFRLVFLVRDIDGLVREERFRAQPRRRAAATAR